MLDKYPTEQFGVFTDFLKKPFAAEQKFKQQTMSWINGAVWVH